MALVLLCLVVPRDACRRATVALDALLARNSGVLCVVALYRPRQHRRALPRREHLPLLPQQHLLLDAQVVWPLSLHWHDVKLRRRQPLRRLRHPSPPLNHVLGRHLGEEALAHAGSERVHLLERIPLILERPLCYVVGLPVHHGQRHGIALVVTPHSWVRGAGPFLATLVVDAVVPLELVFGVCKGGAGGALDPPEGGGGDGVPVVVVVVVVVGEEPRHAEAGAPPPGRCEVEVHVQTVGEGVAPGVLVPVDLGAVASLRVVEPHGERPRVHHHRREHVQLLDLTPLVLFALQPLHSIDQDLVHFPLRVELEVVVFGDDRGAHVAAHAVVGARRLHVLQLEVVHVAREDELAVDLVVEALAVKRAIMRVPHRVRRVRVPRVRALALVAPAHSARVDRLRRCPVVRHHPIAPLPHRAPCPLPSRNTLGPVGASRPCEASGPSFSRRALDPIWPSLSRISRGADVTYGRRIVSPRALWPGSSVGTLLAISPSISTGTSGANDTFRSWLPHHPCNTPDTLDALSSSFSIWTLEAPRSRHTSWARRAWRTSEPLHPLVPHFSLGPSKPVRSFGSVHSLLTHAHHNVDGDFGGFFLFQLILKGFHFRNCVSEALHHRTLVLGLHARAARAGAEEHVLPNLSEHSRRLDGKAWFMGAVAFARIFVIVALGARLAFLCKSIMILIHQHIVLVQLTFHIVADTIQNFMILAQCSKAEKSRALVWQV
mmetsp:Transcript_49003/g.100014  ORF Transcript_49003/g.100014 Transcript_49003/m.100014 type:complete len:718 (+) Transcript_49003:985-3138(+)